MRRSFTFLLAALLVSCSAGDTSIEAKRQAKRSDSVLLCDVDATGSAVRYRLKQTVTGGAAGFAIGQLLPVTGPTIEPGHRYGDEALLFLSGRGGSSGVSAHFKLILHDGKTTDGHSHEELVRLIQESGSR